MNKVYRMRCIGRERTFAVLYRGEWMYVTFRRKTGDRLGELSTNDTELQMGIEGSGKFKGGEIELAYCETVSEDVSNETEVIDNVHEVVSEANNSREVTNDYGDIDTYGKAKRLLNSDFNIPHSRLRNAEMVDKEAKNLGIVFPCMVNDEA